MSKDLIKIKADDNSEMMEIYHNDIQVFSGNYWEEIDKNEEKNLISMLRINTKCIVYMDSDFENSTEILLQYLNIQPLPTTICSTSPIL